MKILDLFAGGNSVKKALNNDDVISIDITGKDNIILDLSQENIINKLLNVLPKGWKPDFIWASPVCNKLSLATAIKGGHNAYFQVNKEKKTITPWKINVDKKNMSGAKNYMSIVGTEKAYKEVVLTLKMFDNTKRIINYFNVPFVIENPKHGLGKYLLKEYVANECSYCMYGFPQQKNTIIFSDRKIKLLKCLHQKGNHNVGVYGKANWKNKKLITKYEDRSAVPQLLIIEIFNQLSKKLNNDQKKESEEIPLCEDMTCRKCGICEIEYGGTIIDLGEDK